MKSWGHSSTGQHLDEGIALEAPYLMLLVRLHLQDYCRVWYVFEA